MPKNRILQVKESTIKVIAQNENDYISLTDMISNFKEEMGWLENGLPIKIR